MVVVAKIGKAPAVGDLIGGERAAVLARAVSTRKLTTALLDDKDRPSLFVSFPSQDADGIFVTAQESALAPTTPVPTTDGSPFADLRGAFYAGPPLPANLLLTTAKLPLRGALVRTSVPIGTDTFTTTIAARSALVGAGYPEPMHALGHQLGRSAHDGGTTLAPRWDRYGAAPLGLVEEGNVFTLEYGTAVPGRGYIGLEEDVVVTASGVEWLSTPQRDVWLVP